MIELKEITYKFQGAKILFEKFSLKISSGEKVLLLGKNGSGKTSLLRILSGLYYPVTGTYIFNGTEINKGTVKKMRFYDRIGFLFQNPDAMCFNSTVEEEIFFGIEHTEQKEKLFQELCDLTGLKPLLSQSPLNLSGGEKQKVLLVAVLLKEPELLLLDEPIAHLDPYSSGWLGEFLANYPITMVVATQSLSWGNMFSNRIIILSSTHKVAWDQENDPATKVFPPDEILLENNLAYKNSQGEVIYF
jgi:cobalt/nickel transport system ATP-binding protein